MRRSKQTCLRGLSGGTIKQLSRIEGQSAVKVRELIDLLKHDGWYLVSTRGSHRQYKHRTKPGRVTVAGKMNDDLAPGTLNSILKQAGLKE